VGHGRCDEIAAAEVYPRAPTIAPGAPSNLLEPQSSYMMLCYI
jgi:hypothetical protein